MAEPRKGRIVKRTLWSVVILIWLLAAYIASYGVVNWLLPGRIINQDTAFKIQGSFVFRPINWYESTDLPGALGLTTLSRWCVYHGQGSQMSWTQAVPGAKHQREMRRMNAELLREHLRKQEATSRATVDEPAQ